MRLTAAQIAAYASGAGFPPGEVVTAVAVALAESGGETTQLGDVKLQNATWGPSVGLWQIRSETDAALARETNAVDRLRVQAKLTDPTYNAQVAHAVWAAHGWGPWSTYPLASTRYLPQARAAVKNPAAVPAAGTGTATTSTGVVAPVSYTGGAAFQSVGLLGDGLGLAKNLVLPLNLLSDGASVADSARAAAGLLAGLVSFVAKAAVWLSDAGNWLRILKVWAGSWLTVLGILMFGWPAISPAAQAVAKVIPAGKVATAAGTKAAGAATAAGATKAAAAPVTKAAPKAAAKAKAAPAKAPAKPAAKKAAARPKVATA